MVEHRCVGHRRKRMIDGIAASRPLFGKGVGGMSVADANPHAPMLGPTSVALWRATL